MMILVDAWARIFLKFRTVMKSGDIARIWLLSMTEAKTIQKRLQKKLIHLF